MHVNDAKTRGGTVKGVSARARLLAGIPVAEKHEELAGIRTAYLVGGEGPPMVLLHGPAGNATHWMRVIPGLITSHRVIVPDLPGHGASEGTNGPLGAPEVLRWLDDLIHETSTKKPVLVGHALGGAIAAHFASKCGESVSELILVDTLGLRPFQPAPEFGRAVNAFFAEPTERTYEQLWRYCALDLDALRDRMGTRWELFTTYNLDRIQSADVHRASQSLMAVFGLPPIGDAVLSAIPVPVSMIWGRHDLATPLSVAEAASARYGWPLSVIENCADDPPMERPEALLRELASALYNSDKAGSVT